MIMRNILAISVLALLLACPEAKAQFGPGRAPEAPFSLTTESWNARWISVPDTDPHGYGVYYFRKDLEMASVPGKYVVLVTGDNRYKLYVNEELVSLGPARGDATHWNYETVDIAPYLKVGKNVVAALVYNEGEQKTESNVSVSTGFLLQGIDEAKLFYTDNTWKCIQDPAYKPVRQSVPGYYVSGPGEEVDMHATIAGWNTAAVDTGSWKNARAGMAGTPKNFVGNSLSNAHALQPSAIPQLERRYQRLQSVRQDSGLKIPAGFPSETAALTVPAGTTAEILLDQGHLTNGFFSMRFSGGAGASISIGYAEALYEPTDNPRRGGNKGNRNEVEGKTFIGREDRLISNGGENQKFTTLAWRTWRYVKLTVKTGDSPLTVDDIYSTFVGYPFEMNAHLDTDNAEMLKMLEIGWRTARLCALETYMDCPFYEQLQYLGDTRIQALVSLYNSGDDRLVKNYFNLADISRNPEGVTMGRYPTTSPQYITTYALTYIFSLHDYMMYGKDTQFIMDKLPGVEQILGYFSGFQLEDGRVRDLPGWNFSDWVYVPSWNFGAPLKGADGCSILVDLQLLLALQMASEMELYRGNTYHGNLYRDEAAKLAASIRKSYWSETRGLFADRAEKDNFSQHANALAIICGLADGETAREIGRKLVEDKTLAPASVYFKFYLHEALAKAGFGDDYMKWLDIWRENIAMGLTTWGETSDVSGTRSDCHAWGSSPNIEFFRTVLGIDSAAPAFRKMRIAPHLGDIKEIGGSMPHPDGTVSVSYKRKGKNGIKAAITLPEGVSGTFVWNGNETVLKPGENSINL